MSQHKQVSIITPSYNQEDFIEEKLGVTHVSRMTNMQDTSDLCCEVFNRLGNINKFIDLIKQRVTP